MVDLCTTAILKYVCLEEVWNEIFTNFEEIQRILSFIYYVLVTLIVIVFNCHKVKYFKFSKVNLLTHDWVVQRDLAAPPIRE